MQALIPVNLPQHSYEVAIAPSSLDQLGTWMQGTETRPLKLGKNVLLVSNPAVFQHYGTRAIAALEQAGFTVATCLLPDGEQHKTLETLTQIYDAALANHLERSSTFVALGGGIIGDMTGFAAATWLRGVNVVQVPTTLLAMVDAAIGGKTGVNHPHGKNLIGAFHQPRLVLIDPQVLQTLPVREFRAAIAEVIKYGVIWDADLFSQLEAAPQLDQLANLSADLLQAMLTHSCQAKAHIVSKDEKEAGLRAILNYGHTIGHAVESLTGYQVVNHGEAVAIGMVAAAEIAVALQLWQKADAQRQLTLLQNAHLPTRLPAGIDLDAILTSLQADKKVEAGQVRFVLPTQIGAAIVTDQVPTTVIRQVLKQMQTV
ncbi:3-dehydroquinate synthase [Phormidium sp. FACHB-592]|uniref:3-dehydroquinate synthase n=1 Tax=Stenomitos frigidus AS-A4 TaxID=2933935 RepID=A0ABV0KCA1_9CYAN|nr:3-dehydroquinate synthase [Phormidium sp. FACHB-592]MBD2077479.1 3-dehydroquinate synthase [Phormidium sp. FACHB-592]